VACDRSVVFSGYSSFLLQYILLKVALSTINQPTNQITFQLHKFTIYTWSSAINLSMASLTYITDQSSVRKSTFSICQIRQKWLFLFVKYICILSFFIHQMLTDWWVIDDCWRIALLVALLLQELFLTSTSTFYDNPSMVMITCRAQRSANRQKILKRGQII
jgi:hypothetical protein